jgi:hypothetical protein
VFLNQVVSKLLFFDFSQYVNGPGSGIDNPLSTIQHSPGSSVEVIVSDQSASTDSRIQMMQDKERILAASEWLRLADVIDRLFLILYLLLVVGFSLGFIGYL